MTVRQWNDFQTPHQVMRAGLVRVFDLFVSARWPATDTYFIPVSTLARYTAHPEGVITSAAHRHGPPRGA